MHFSKLAVLAASVNLALGSPVFAKKSRDVVADHATKRALGAEKRDFKSAYGYKPTPRPSVRSLRSRALENGFKSAYEYKPTPRPSVEDLSARGFESAYEYKPAPRPSVEDLSAASKA